jgi:hypothetical protein
MAGANNISFGWDDSISRFTIGDLHVGIVSPADGQNEGGQDEIKIYIPAVPYKQNQTKSGGIYISKWASGSITPVSMGIQTITEDRKLATNFDFGHVTDSTPWFLGTSNDSDVGARFWNKLGFSNDQIGVNGTLENATTENEIDTTAGIVLAGEPSVDLPAYQQLGNYSKKADGTLAQATYVYSSVGNLNFSNHAAGMGGIPNTQGSPIQFELNYVDSGFSRTGISTLTQAGSFVQSECTYNPDREINTYYTVTTSDDMTSLIEAANLPTKTEFSYFYVLSDLVDTNFYSSKNGGMPINCIGIINKLNSDNDFYFSYSSPQRFYVTKDRVVTSITTTIRNPDFSAPALISAFSSIIYQIDRINPIPEQMPDPTFVQQQAYYARLDQLVALLLEQNKLPDSDADIENVLESLYIGDSNTKDIQNIAQDVVQAGLQIDLRKKQEESDLDDLGRMSQDLAILQREIEKINNLPNPTLEQKQMLPQLQQQAANLLDEIKQLEEVPSSPVNPRMDPTIKDIFVNFIIDQINQNKIKQRPNRDVLKAYMNKLNIPAGVQDEAIQNFAMYQEMRRGVLQSIRTTGEVNPELIKRIKPTKESASKAGRPPADELPVYIQPPIDEDEE